jgi:hypothetical protein
MSRTSYYLLNHTLSEFCYFDENISIFDSLEKILVKWPEWKRDHVICVMAEEYCKTEATDTLLHERGYRWLDVDVAPADAADAAPN